MYKEKGAFMYEYIYLGLGGIVICALSFLLKKREKRLFENAVPAKATVLYYDEYQQIDNPSAEGGLHKMYTAVVSYALADGTMINAKEQCGRGYQKYAIGDVLDIEYSSEQPDFFVLRGDKSRSIAFAAMLIFGLAMVAISVLMYLQQ
jgi:hypothetical protein